MSAPSATLPSGATNPTTLNLYPTLSDLLTLHFDTAVWLPLIIGTGYYFWQFWRSRSQPSPLRWPWWKPVLFVLGIILIVLSTQSAAVRLTSNSMALYMARLMVLAELVPPLLVLSLPQGIALLPRRPLGRVLGVLLDPWVALAVWTAVIVFWNVPAGFNASVVANTSGALLPWFYLISSLMVWGVVLRPLPTVQPASVGLRGGFGLLSSLPMMAVAMVWLYSRNVLYTAYVSALCLWDLSPLKNQQISGWIMMLAGLPALALAFVQLIISLIHLADQTEVPAPAPEVAEAE